MSPVEWARALVGQLRGYTFDCPKCRAKLSPEYETEPANGRSVLLKCFICGERVYLWVWDKVEGPYLIVPCVLPQSDRGLAPVPDLEAIQAALRQRRVGRDGTARLE